MTSGTYENELKPISGGVFLDKVLGWFTFICGLPILGVAINRYLHAKPNIAEPVPTWLEPARIVLVVMGLIGILAIITSKRKGFQLAMALYALRVVGLLVLYPWTGGPRFAGSELLFDFVAIGYCWLRLRQPDQNQS